MSRGAPVWLAEPSRLAGWTRRGALIALAGVLALALLCTIAPGRSFDAGSAGGANTLTLYEGVIDGLRAGGDYYQLTADALRASGQSLHPFVMFRLPGHSLVQAMLPRAIVVLLLYALALGVGIAWWRRLAPALSRTPPRVIALLLLAAGMATCVNSDLIGLHELWAAQLVALALALRRPGRWGAAAAIGVMAMLVRETAAVLPLTMALTALAEGERREAAGWCATLALLALVLALHAQAAARIAGPIDAAAVVAHSQAGIGFAIWATAAMTALAPFPHAIAAPILVAGTFGWLGWRDPAGVRVALTLAASIAVTAAFADQDGAYWTLLAAPLSLAGLVFVPDMARDLATAILDRPRIRVQRIVR